MNRTLFAFAFSLSFFLFGFGIIPQNEFANPLDGTVWESATEIQINKTFSLTSNTKLHADRIRIAAPIFTEGYGLEIVARELVFENEGKILGFSKPQNLVKPKAAGKPQAAPDEKHGVHKVRDSQKFFKYYVGYRAEGQRLFAETLVNEDQFLTVLKMTTGYLSLNWASREGPGMPDRPASNYKLPSSPATHYPEPMSLNTLELFLKLNMKLPDEVAQRIHKRVEERIKIRKQSKTYNALSESDAKLLYEEWRLAFADYVWANFLPVDVHRPTDFQDISKFQFVAELEEIISGEQLRNGKDGERGNAGDEGHVGNQNPSPVTIVAEDIVGPLFVHGKGQKGGKGGQGGDGQQGGNGGDGADGYWEPFSTTSPTPGGVGGQGGDAGPGGKGGMGGAPIPISLTYSEARTSNRELAFPDGQIPESVWKFESESGDGGDPGEGGSPGKPGNNGAPGSKGDAPFVGKVGRSAKDRPNNGNGNPWTPGKAEQLALVGKKNPKRPEEINERSPNEYRQTKEVVLTRLYEMQIERNRWLLALQTLGFIFELDGETLADLNSRQGDIYSAITRSPDLQRLEKSIEAWKLHLDKVRPALNKVQSANQVSKDLNSSEWAKAFVSHSENVLNALNGFRDNSVDMDSVVDELMQIKDLQFTRLSDHLDDLSALCESYNQEFRFDSNNQDLFSIFRLKFCIDRDWTEDPMAFFDVQSKIQIIAPENPNIVVIEPEDVDSDALVPPGFRDFLSLLQLNPTFAQTLDHPSVKVRLNDNSFDTIKRSFFVTDDRDSLLRLDRQMRQLRPIELKKLKSSDELYAKLVVLSLNMINLANGEISFEK